MKVTISAILGAVLLAGTAFAGPAPVYSKQPVIPQDPVCAVPFTGTVTVGYDTDFIWRGINLGNDSIHAAVDFNIPLNGALSIDTGAHYYNPTQRDDFDNDTDRVFDQLDVYAALNFPLWIFDASLGVLWRGYPSSDNSVEFDNGIDNEVVHSTTEIFLGLQKDIGFCTLHAHIVRDVEYWQGWYFEYGASKTIALADCLDLNLGAGVSHTLDYGEGDFELDGGQHIYVSGGLTYHLTNNAALNAYVAGNFLYGSGDDVLGDSGFQDDSEVYGGVSLSVSF